jgi:hypothetical protein
VDTLDNVQELPVLIRRSRNIVLFATEEVWSRPFILTELDSAIESAVDVIVFRETDPRYDPDLRIFACVFVHVR